MLLHVTVCVRLPLCVALLWEATQNEIIKKDFPEQNITAEVRVSVTLSPENRSRTDANYLTLSILSGTKEFCFFIHQFSVPVSS